MNVGRSRGFVSEDPGRNGRNWYAYCGNNPVNAVDPSGRVMVPALAVLCVLSAVVALGFNLGYNAYHGEVPSGKEAAMVVIGAVAATLIITGVLVLLGVPTGGASLCALVLLGLAEMAFAYGILAGLAYAAIESCIAQEVALAWAEESE